MEDFQILGIDHVQIAIPINSENEAKNFYIQKLGMKEIEKPEKLRKKGGFWVATGNHQLHLGILNPFVPATKAHPAFEVKNIMIYRESLILKNVKITDDNELENATRFFVHDPFGNRIEFLEWRIY